jgi:predicted amidohydrolase
VIIALASPRVATSIDDGLAKIKVALNEAAAQSAEIVCFPEAYVPGLRGLDFPAPDFDPPWLERVLDAVAAWSRESRITTILGVERFAPTGRQIAAAVIGPTGELLGFQTKNQLDPTEDALYVPGESRQLFECNGVTFGIAICHEGFRYPETVRWAARRGAQIVFHPHCTGSDLSGPALSRWGDANGPYYEKAMMCRALENTIYFASVNYAFRFQESATSVIDPSGKCIAHLPYGREGVLVQSIDLTVSSGKLAWRYKPECCQ